LKRTVDVIVTLMVMLLGSPFLLGIALAIRLSSPGPIFYSQKRIGRGGKTFSAWKFRSMVPDADRVLQHYLDTDPIMRREWETNHKLQRDPRVTWIGKLLRATSMDELPQLWNILVGDMSFVGPRPERPEFMDLLNARYPLFGLRTARKPGLTGWAQVRYTYGASVEDALQKLQYDLFYIKNLSIWLDLAIIVQTVKIVLRGRGAR
jgi:lipopolysaccharide/colanic/teichoic acid biosynthesis glycosyltransferase